MTKTSQQLATKLARKCAIDIDLFVMNAPRAKNQEEALALLSNSILQSMPLVELLELRNSANSFVELVTVSRQQKLVDALATLTTKLHQLGIEI